MNVRKQMEGDELISTSCNFSRRSKLLGSKLLILNGGRDRTRTCDLLRVKQAL